MTKILKNQIKNLLLFFANSIEPDQNTTLETVWSEFILFASIKKSTLKSVFRVFDQERFESVCSAMETSWHIEFLHVASLSFVFSRR